MSKMKVVTVVGTRPEIIRLSRVIERLDGLCEHVLVHTGQNFDPRLKDVFFDELGVRAPDRELGITGSIKLASNETPHPPLPASGIWQ